VLALQLAEPVHVDEDDGEGTAVAAGALGLLGQRSAEVAEAQTAGERIAATLALALARAFLLELGDAAMGLGELA